MLTIEQQANRWVVREKSGAFDAGEQAALQAWCGADVRHQGAYLRALAIHAALEDAANVDDNGFAPAAAQAPKPGAFNAARPGTGRRAALWYGAMAAGLAVAVGAGVFMAQPRSETYATVTGEFRKVPLGDQSVAHINSASRIVVTLTGSERRVDLVRGEAWFDVAKDKSRPFVVSAGEARARAVGTSFSVVKQEEGAEVLVTEGVVEVWRQDGAGARKVVLNAGESAAVPASGEVAVTRQPEEIARKLAWRDGKMVFRNQALSEAVAEFNRYSRKPIVIADRALASRTLVGRYKVDDPELFAREVAAYLRVPVSITHERIILGNVRLLDGRAEPGNISEGDQHKN